MLPSLLLTADQRDPWFWKLYVPLSTVIALATVVSLFAGVKEPDKPFTGKIVLRVSPDLHRQLYAEAKREGKSLNALVEERLSTTGH